MEQTIKQTRTKHMTDGSPLRLLFLFSLPLMAGNLCQQLYTVVDTAVVGKQLGVDALAALGAVDWLNWLVLSVIQGFAQGFAILMAQQFGAGQFPQTAAGCDKFDRAGSDLRNRNDSSRAGMCPQLAVLELFTYAGRNSAGMDSISQGSVCGHAGRNGL